MRTVDCICLTFNRMAVNPTLIEEAVESFLRQTYQNTRLWIVNDCPHQKVRFNHPRVTVLNLCKRARTLGEKYNIAIDAGEAEFICGWEDDDISLPHRLEYSLDAIGDADYFNPLGYYFRNNKLELHHKHSIGVCHNCSIFTRKAFEAVGKYDHVTGNQDALMDRKLRTQKASLVPIPIKDWSYIYSFGQSDYHISSQPDMQKAYNRYEKKAVKSGIFTIKPYWRVDYKALCQNYLKANNLA